MFKKWGNNTEERQINNHREDPVKEVRYQTANTILKGSKLIGNINITCDLELSGEIEGNITSEQDSNIVIKGTCKGNIQTREGNVDIKGELIGGNITAGSDVIIVGKYNGGEIKANGKIHLNGEFDGRLEANEIEIGPNAQGKGEILYREYISISKGARVEGQISKVPSELKLIKNVPETRTSDTEPPAKEMSSA